MGRRAKPAKVKAEAKRPLARKAPQKETSGIHELEKRLAEALEQQTATSEILRVISSSPTDVQPIFDTIARNADVLCDSLFANVFRFDGELLHFVATSNTKPEALELMRSLYPMRPNVSQVSGRVVLTKSIVHLQDALADPDYDHRFPSIRGWRRMLGVPMMRDGIPLGAIVVAWEEPGPIVRGHEELLKTFADQAVIAIENVRLFNETKEALEQQTATAEILKVISSSPTDIQPVFDAILENATRLCDAHMGHLGLYDGEKFQDVAQRGANAEFAKFLGERGPFRPSPGGVYARMTAERQPIHVADRRDSPEYRDRLPMTVALVELGGVRSLLAVPMLKEGRVVGGIVIYRPEVRPFTQKQIDLVSTFANQAVIAIENVRLFKELQARNAEITESLEQQTATAEILRVISSSPTNVQPVLDAVAEYATRVCEAGDAAVILIDGAAIRLAAHYGTIPAVTRDEAIPINRGTVVGRAILERKPVHVPDLLAADDFPEGRILGARFGNRTTLATPLLREGTPIGALLIRRTDVRPFTDKQIALLQTFASQAVIAIENVRLFKELQTRNFEITESLEQQTATADILRVISSSPTDLQPVFDAILENATRLCDAHLGILGLYDGKMYRAIAQRGASAEFAHWLLVERGAFDPSPLPGLGPMIVEKRPNHVLDMKDSPGYRQRQPITVKSVDEGRIRSYVSVPMLKEGRVVGGIAIYRPVVQPFTQKQIDLVSTFANQAVIAIENVRLFNETKEALEQQTVISEILRVIGSSPTDVQPVFDAIVKSGVHLFGGMNVSLRLLKGNYTETVASTLPIHETGGANPVPLDDESTPASRTILRREVVQVPDAFAEEWRGTRFRQRAEQRGFRAFLCAPMLRENNAIGAISVTRAMPGPFTDKEVALLRTFADQAVIAIENVRLFKELQARNAEVTESLEQQTATADILRVISSSPTDLQPVFDAILEKAIRLCDAHMGHLRLYDGEKFQGVAQRGASAEYAKFLSERGPYRAPSGGVYARMTAERQPIQIADPRNSCEYRDGLPGIVALVELGGARTFIAVPMLKEGRVVGGITIYRPEVRPFTQKQIDLVSTFANQAVIAIENVRLFNEINEALQRQTSIAEILRVISSSPTDVMPVLEAVTHRAAQLCDAPDARLFLVDGDALRYVVGFGEFKGVVQALPLTRGIVTGRAIIDRVVVHIEDLAAAFDEFPEARDPQQQFGHRTTLAVPLVRENKAFGGILMRRKEVRPFSEKQIELVKTFADQAVIAIENVRLFNEIQDKSRQLEVASRHKSQFLANMSHELRTPLNAVLGYTELILDGIYGDVSEKVRDVMGRVDKSGRHLLGLINDVLDLSKIEAGQLTLSLADYSLTDVVQTVFTSVESLAAEKKLALKAELASDLPRGRGDDRRLAQVLLNLVGNAIKFTEAGEVRLEARCSDGAFVVSVADTGPGISETDQQRIFEEFQQVDDSATRKKGGTGLGLSIARRIIELHGGRIQVESAPGRGATFTFTLPVRVERQAGPS